MHRSTAAGLAALALMGLVGPGCSSDSPTTSAAASSGARASSASAPRATAQRTSACKPVPPPGPALEWLPADLPLPPGSYATVDTESPSTSSDPAAGMHRGFMVVKSTVADFKALVETQWPAAGYALGRGDSEAGEAEGGYRKGDFGGAYRVRDVYCDAAMSELLLTYGKGATESD